jgi:hypothetical protein
MERKIPKARTDIDFRPSSHYEGVSKSFRTGRLEQELQMVQLSATRCSRIAILWVSLVSCAAITLCIAAQRVFVVVVVYFVIDSVRKLLDTPSYTDTSLSERTQQSKGVLKWRSHAYEMCSLRFNILGVHLLWTQMYCCKANHTKNITPYWHRMYSSSFHFVNYFT